MNSTTVNEQDLNIDQIQVAKFLRAKGTSIRGIGQVLGRSGSTIQNWLARPSTQVLQAITPLEPANNRTTLSDSAGNPLAIMNSEADFVCAYGKDLIRKTKGCDFRDPDTKELIEVKSFAVNPRQCMEMAQEFHDHKRRAILGSVQDDVVLIFRLESILRIPTSESESQSFPVAQATIEEKMSAPVTSRVSPLEVLPSP